MRVVEKHSSLSPLSPKEKSVLLLAEFIRISDGNFFCVEGRAVVDVRPVFVPNL